MSRLSMGHKKKVIWLGFAVLLVSILLFGRLIYIMVFCSSYYIEGAKNLHERERDIKAARGRILDRNGKVLADNTPVCTVSVIHSQITDAERVIEVLMNELGISREEVTKRVSKISAIERVKSNIPKEVGDRIRSYDLDGVKVDNDYKRYYPYDELASKVLGFTGSDNQGIIGIEVKYEEYLKGTPGKILTVTDARGVELEKEGETRIEPIQGNDLVLSIDRNIQEYATQLAKKALKEKEAESVSIMVMNPNNGEMLAMVNVPEFNLNEPYILVEPFCNDLSGNSISQNEMTDAEKTDAWNRMWRNGCINDTYEPGSIFKTVTAAAALETDAVKLDETYTCGGSITVENRRIRCHKVQGHGTQTFVQGTMNSCNPFFVTIGLRLGVDRYYDYFKQFGLLEKTGVDLPGEAATIMHKKEDIHEVELATMAFGQSFQITPIELLTTVASFINGGKRVTPHFAIRAEEDGKTVQEFEYKTRENIISQETVDDMKMILEAVVAEGGGKKGAVEGYRIGGKTATSQTLPRNNGVYIASFIGFAPADDPKVIGLVIINHPIGIYYGGQIAAPVLAELYKNILPYLESMDYNY